MLTFTTISFESLLYSAFTIMSLSCSVSCSLNDDGIPKELQRSLEDLTVLIQLCGKDASIFSFYDNYTQSCLEPESYKDHYTVKVEPRLRLTLDKNITTNTHHCGERGLFVALNAVYGACHCYQALTNNQLLLALYKPDNRCYYVYTQGPCKPDYHVQLRDRSTTYDGSRRITNREAICERSPCPGRINCTTEDILNRACPEVVYFNGRCERMGSHQPECEENYVVGFELGFVGPKCVYKDMVYFASTSTGLGGFEDTCPKETYRSLSGECLPRSRFVKESNLVQS